MSLPTYPLYIQYQVPPVDAGNLNELNRVTYTILGNGVSAPLNASEVLVNLGLGGLTAISLADGTVTTPGLAWGNEGGLGWYRIGLHNRGFASTGHLLEQLDAGTDLTLNNWSLYSPGPPASGHTNLNIFPQLRD